MHAVQTFFVDRKGSVQPRRRKRSPARKLTVKRATLLDVRSIARYASAPERTFIKVHRFRGPFYVGYRFENGGRSDYSMPTSAFQGEGGRGPSRIASSRTFEPSLGTSLVNGVMEKLCFEPKLASRDSRDSQCRKFGIWEILKNILAIVHYIFYLYVLYMVLYEFGW